MTGVLRERGVLRHAGLRLSAEGYSLLRPKAFGMFPRLLRGRGFAHAVLARVLAYSKRIYKEMTNEPAA